VKGTMKEITDRPLAKRNLFGFSEKYQFFEQKSK